MTSKDDAREALVEAIKAYDAAMQEDEYPAREGDEILTHWVVLYSHAKFDDDLGSSQVSMICTPGMAYWMIAGLLSAHTYAELTSPWRDDG